jgi:hypothetical protein
MTDCVVSDNINEGIRVGDSSGAIINNSIISGNTNDGIKCLMSSPSITNCIISANTNNGINCYIGSPIITNCTVSGNGGSGILSNTRVRWGSHPNVLNSIIWGNTNYEIYAGYKSSAKIAYSDIDRHRVIGNVILLNGNIDEDPLFVDPGYGDYYLQPGSPCIDVGTGQGAPLDDIDGEDRPFDGKPDMQSADGLEYDMGAYEFKFVEVTIDIKPDDAANIVNLHSAGVIPVAIFSSEDFDAATIDPATIILAEAGVKTTGKRAKYLCRLQDVNGDGLADIVCQVYTGQFMAEPEESTAMLEAETFDGNPVWGKDNVNIVQRK